MSGVLKNLPLSLRGFEPSGVLVRATGKQSRSTVPTLFRSFSASRDVARASHASRSNYPAPDTTLCGQRRSTWPPSRLTLLKFKFITFFKRRLYTYFYVVSTRPMANAAVGASVSMNVSSNLHAHARARHIGKQRRRQGRLVCLQLGVLLRLGKLQWSTIIIVFHIFTQF